MQVKKEDNVKTLANVSAIYTNYKKASKQRLVFE